MPSKLCLLALAAPALAAIASPATAWPRHDTTIPLATDNVFWGLQNKPAYGYGHDGHGHRHGYGAVIHPRAGRRAPAAAAPPTFDCVHVNFPQCSAGG